MYINSRILLRWKRKVSIKIRYIKPIVYDSMISIISIEFFPPKFSFKIKDIYFFIRSLVLRFYSLLALDLPKLHDL